ncbi:rhomboid-like protein [Streptomyces sp. NPDC050610]|uniref:rhomboid-like protein n=1 Tax=Streptomyces sp. NPDC050610 TaxID=3157097 RepID=UPI00341C843F
MTLVDAADVPVVTQPEAARPLAPTWLRRALEARPWGILPTPLGTPFTFVYALVLMATAAYADYGDQETVSRLLRDSSTDVAHLSDRPLLVLVASALWVAGGLQSAYGVAFLFILTALERRVGGLRTVGVFLLGHVVATLATELPVAWGVAMGELPTASLHRLDYGISFGLMACTGALAGLLPPWARWTLLGSAGLLCARDLLEYLDPLSAWGHPLAGLVGIACWPAIRQRVRARERERERAMTRL